MKHRLHQWCIIDQVDLQNYNDVYDKFYIITLDTTSDQYKTPFELLFMDCSKYTYKDFTQLVYNFICLPLQRHFKSHFQKRTAQDSLGSIPPIPAIPLPRVWVFTGITKCSALRSPFLVLLIVRKHPLWFGLTPLPSWLNMNRGVPLIMMLPLEVSLTPYIPFTTNYWTPYTIIN